MNVYVNEMVVSVDHAISAGAEVCVQLESLYGTEASIYVLLIEQAYSGTEMH